MLERVAHGGPSDAFVMSAVRLLKERARELDPARIAMMSWIASAPRVMEWPYVPPDYEMMIDVVSTDGVGYVVRHGAYDEPLPPVRDDDPLFAPIQPPIPLSKIDLSMCGAMIYTGALRVIVLVSNVPFAPAFVEQVGRMNATVVALGAPREREIRLITFPWDPKTGTPENLQRTSNYHRETPEHGPRAPAPDATRTMTSSAPTPQLSPAQQATNRGNALAREGKLEDALRAHDEAIRLDPNYALAWCNKAYVLSAMGRQEESLRAAQRATQIDPTFVQGWINVSQALVSLSRFAEAITAAQRGLAIDATVPELHYNLATAADKTYKQPLAVQHYRLFVQHAKPGMQGAVARIEQRLRMFRN